MTQKTDSNLMSFLPFFIRNRFEGRHNLQKILGNTGWLFFDNILRMGVGLVVGVWLARYLGPLQFGLLNYTIAFSAIFGVFATLGLDDIVIRDLVRHPERREVILGTAFTLKLMGGFLCLLMTLTSIAIMRSGDSLSFWLVGLSAAGFIFQSLNVINLYFRFRVESKYAVYGSGAAFIIVSLVKIALLMGHAPLIAFGWAGLAEVVLASFFLLIVYRRHHNDVRAWKFKKDIALELLRDSYPLILSNLAIMLYMRIDQVMLGQMRGDAEVGIFSAAVRISEVWYFIPGIIYSSVFSTIIAIRRHDEILYYQKLQKLFDVMALIGLSVAIVSIYISPYAVRILFGVNYAASSDVLSIHIWTGVFYCLGVASGCWFIAENLQKYVFYRTAYGAIINIMLNLYMIPAYGSKGAAISTIISQAFASVFFNSFNAETRPLFIRQIRALSPYRIFLKC